MLDEKTDPLRFRFDGRLMAAEWQAWLASDEGRALADPAGLTLFSTATPGPYLENRLARAWRAGMEAALKLEDARRAPVVKGTDDAPADGKRK